VAVHLKNNRHVEGIGQDSELCTGGYLYCAVPRGNDAVVSALRPDDSVDEWTIAGVTGLDNFGEFPGRITSLSSPAQTPQVTTHQVDQAYDVILDKFGAFPRDNTDTRIEGEVRSGTGQWKQNKSNDNNTYTGSAPADTDNDGMADAWEQDNGGNLDPNGHDLHQTYDNIEVYINGLADNLTGTIPVPSGIENQSVRTHAHLLSMNLASANPVRHKAVIRYSLPGSTQKKHDITISVFNVYGKQVATILNGTATSGFHRVTWNGTDNSGQSVSSGVYLVKLNTERATLSRKIFLFK
jgi:hypothetical protein